MGAGSLEDQRADERHDVKSDEERSVGGSIARNSSQIFVMILLMAYLWQASS